MKVAIVAGTTETARIDGISAAGASSELLVHTPSADLEIVAHGRPVDAPVVPVSPSGCPTPAVVTRAVRELVEFDLLAIDAGLARPAAVPTRDVGANPGGDVRAETPVPGARSIFERAREIASEIEDDELVVGETIPGGTTTALGVLTALGERERVSSSLPENPLSRKREIVATGLAASDLPPGAGTEDPLEAVLSIGDPVLSAVAGLIAGGAETDTTVTLAGGTQLAAAAAIARHLGVDAQIELATTSFLADDETAAIDGLAADLDLDLTVTDPGFDRSDHRAMTAYVAGEAKEGVGMGGALALADRADVPMCELRDRIVQVYDRLLASVRNGGR